MKNNAMIKNMISRVASLSVIFLVTMVITKITVQKSGDELYGFYSLANDFVNYAMILSIALNSMAGRYITISYYNESKEDVNKYFNSILFANIVLCCLIAVPMFLFIFFLDKIINIAPQDVNHVKMLFLFMFLNFGVTIISSVFTVGTFIKNRVDLDSYRSIESNVIKIILIIVSFSLFQSNIAYLGMATLASTLYVFAVNIYYLKKLTPEIKPFKKQFINFNYIKKVIHSGIWNSITRIGAILLNGMDLLIANLMVSTSAMGVLSVSKTLPKYFISAISSFSAVFTPSITIEYAKKNKQKLINKLTFAIKICSVFSNMIETIIIVLGTRIYTLWVPNQNSHILHILSIIAILGFCIILPLEPLWSVFTVTDKVKISSMYLIVEAVVTITTVAVLLQIVPKGFWQLVVIAGVSSLAEIIRGITFLPMYSAHCLQVQKRIFYKLLNRILAALVVTLSISFVIMRNISEVGWIGLFVMCIIIGFISVIINLLVVFDKQERKQVISSLNMLRKINK